MMDTYEISAELSTECIVRAALRARVGAGSNRGAAKGAGNGQRATTSGTDTSERGAQSWGLSSASPPTLLECIKVYLI